MHKSNATPAPIVKGGSFGKFQYPKNQYELDQMKVVPYACFGHRKPTTCTSVHSPDLTFITGVLGRYQENPGIEHWKMIKRTLRYVKGTKNYMLTYRRSDSLEIIGFRCRFCGR
jgi:hypothetical protein